MRLANPPRGHGHRRWAKALGAGAALVAVLAGDAAWSAQADCRRVPVVTAACFQMGRAKAGCKVAPPPCRTIRAKLFGSNGTPGLRMAPRGSRRILGIYGGDGDAESPNILPANVLAAMHPPSPGDLLPVSGRFIVCPLAAERPGWMQPVCVVQGRDPVIGKRPGD
jgi:hypothetical protein